MLSLLWWQQKDFHGPQQDWELFRVLQVSDRVAVLPASSLTDTVLGIDAGEEQLPHLHPLSNSLCVITE